MSAAIISDCTKYRYFLRRACAAEQPKSSVLFIGVNPSTADATQDDATVRKWRGFAKRWGYSSFDVVNLFAYRATDVRELATCADPIGPENDSYIYHAITYADLVVPCWGSRSKLPPHLQGRILQVMDMMRSTPCAVSHLGLTASGDPKHPLMLSYDTPLTRWEAVNA